MMFASCIFICERRFAQYTFWCLFVSPGIKTRTLNTPLTVGAGHAADTEVDRFYLVFHAKHLSAFLWLIITGRFVKVLEESIYFPERQAFNLSAFSAFCGVVLIKYIPLRQSSADFIV